MKLITILTFLVYVLNFLTLEQGKCMYLYGYVTADNRLASDIAPCNKAKIKIKIRYVMTYEGLVESNVTDKTK